MGSNEIADGRCAQDDAGFARLLLQRIQQKAVLDHMGEWLAWLDVARKGEKDRPHRVFEPAVGHHHVEDRLRLAGGALPDAERFEQSPRSGDNRRGAFVAVMTFVQSRVGHHDRSRRTQALTQRERKRQAGKARAGDDNGETRVVLVLTLDLALDLTLALTLALALGPAHGGCSWTASEHTIARFPLHLHIVPLLSPLEKAVCCLEV